LIAAASTTATRPLAFAGNRDETYFWQLRCWAPFRLEGTSAVPSASATDIDECLVAVSWAPSPVLPAYPLVRAAASTAAHATGHWLVVAEARPEPLPGLFVDRLAELGVPARLQEIDLERQPELDLAGARGIVLICPPACPHYDQTGLHRARQRADRLAVLAAAAAGSAHPRLLVVTRDAQPVRPGHGTALEQATLRGAARVLMARHPMLALTQIDLAANEPADRLAAQLVAEATALPGPDHEVAWRDGIRLAAQLTPAPLRPEERRRDAVYFGHDGVAVAPYDQADPGTLELTRWPRRRPGNGEAEIAVRALLLPAGAGRAATGQAEPPGPTGPAAECAGFIASVGRGVTGWRAGDRVAVSLDLSTNGPIRNFFTVAAEQLRPIANELGFEAAACAPPRSSPGGVASPGSVVLPAGAAPSPADSARPVAFDARLAEALATDPTVPLIITVSARGSAKVAVSPSAVPVVRHDGSYVITGGLGRMGLLMARWLALHDAGMIVLNGRGAPSAYARLVLDELRQGGAHLEIVNGDVSAAETCGALVAAATAGGLPLRAVVHAAAPEPAARMGGAWQLHHACGDEPLDWWLTLSGATDLLGLPGSVGVGAAESWLDAFATWRRAQGLPTFTVSGQDWADRAPAGSAGPGTSGEPLDPQLGAAACERLLRHDRSRVGLLPADTIRKASMNPGDLARRIVTVR
jgi:hypothetical protein